MKFPWFWRWRKSPDDDTPVQPTPTQSPPAATAATVDLTLTRRMFYRAVNPSLDTPCPRCGKTLSPEPGVYFIATRQGGQQGDHFMISGDFGFYCGACPTVVIDPEKLIDLLQVGATRWDVGDAYTVLGLIAMEAIPEDQRDVPIDELDAIPLVPFEPGDRPRRSSKPRRRKGKSKRKKRR
jgi:hypothetical protein